jgi:hypothetical protein
MVIKLRKMKWLGHVACMEDTANAHKILVGNPEGNMPLERPVCVREDNITLDLKEIG